MEFWNSQMTVEHKKPGKDRLQVLGSCYIIVISCLSTCFWYFTSVKLFTTELVVQLQPWDAKWDLRVRLQCLQSKWSRIWPKGWRHDLFLSSMWNEVKYFNNVVIQDILKGMTLLLASISSSNQKTMVPRITHQKYKCHSQYLLCFVNKFLGLTPWPTNFHRQIYHLWSLPLSPALRLALVSQSGY